MHGKRYGQGRDVMHDPARKVAFGLDRRAKWPDEGMPPTRINGVLHVVFSKEELRNRPAGAPNRRCLARCPSCGKWVCAGHIGQHMASHAKED